MAKIVIPDALKADAPPTVWGKILTATPVILTVVATGLAGLASSEMTRAQYSRSFAAQEQSKAGDQWGFFQAKKLRSGLQHNALDLLHSTTDVQPLDAATLTKAGASPATVTALQQGRLPDIGATPAASRELEASLRAVENGNDLPPAFAQVPNQELAKALRVAQDRAKTFDAAASPITETIDHLEKSLAGSSQALTRDFIAARMRYTANRYETEARLNQAIANLYELQVRRSNSEAERHHNRSQQFFLGMLGAQAGVIIATFSLAARQRSLLWVLAAAAGAAAIVFAIYVYLFV